MTQPAKVQEPSMEEILASIRRIIADDEAEAPVAAQSPAKPAAAAAAKGAPGAAGASAMAHEPAKPVAKSIAKSASGGPAPNRPVSNSPVSNSQDDIDALMADFDAPAAPPPLPEDDVLELTDDMAVPDSALSDMAPPEPAPEVTDLAFEQAEPANDREFNEIAMTSEHRYATAVRPSGADRGEAPVAAEMLSRSTVSAVESAFNSLANTVLSNNARTLEDLVREMLRPMLKSWLDDNLPGLVERIVKAEIERVSRGR